MSDGTVTHTSLPEDLAPILKHVEQKQTDITVRISQRYIGLSRAAHEALGKPQRIEVLFGPVSRMLAIRAVAVVLVALVAVGAVYGVMVGGMG